MDDTNAEQETAIATDEAATNQEEQHVGHLREAGRNIQRTAGAGLRREYQDDFIQLRINEQQRQYTFNIMRDFVFLGIFLYYFFFRDILGVRNLMFHFIYTGLTGKIYNETEIQEATNILLGNTATTSEDNDALLDDIMPVSLEGLLEEVGAPIQKTVRSQPNCTRLEMLHMFVEDYVNKTSLEAWNRQQKNQRVNRSDMVLPIILFLMLASLAATIWEVVQVRFVTGSSTTNDGFSKNKKHSLSRKCSLADLTVLRHDRKELRRKESGLAIYEHHGYGPGESHGKGSGGGPPGNIKMCRPLLRDN